MALGKYKVSETLHEEYLPRRFRSILAAQRAGASTRLIEPDEQDGTNQFLQPKRAVVAMETAEDDEVGATLRGDDCGDSFGAGDVNLSQNTGDEQGQNFMSLGEELVCVFYIKNKFIQTFVDYFVIISFYLLFCDHSIFCLFFS